MSCKEKRQFPKYRKKEYTSWGKAVPSSSLVEVKVEVGVEFEVEVEVGVEVGFLRCNLDLSLVVVSTFTGGWVVGRLEGNA